MTGGTGHEKNKDKDGEDDEKAGRETKKGSRSGRSHFNFGGIDSAGDPF
jgi:hypothetical protein